MKNFKKHLYLFAGSIYLIDGFKRARKQMNKLEEEFVKEFEIDDNSKMYEEETVRFGFYIIKAISFLLMLPFWPVLLVIDMITK